MNSSENSTTPRGSGGLAKQYREDFLRLEGWLAIIGAGAFAACVENLHPTTVLDAVLKDNRGPVYGALASVFGALLGFVITTLSIVLGFSNHERLQLLKKTRHYRTLWNVFTSATWSLSVSTAIPVIALLFDRDKNPIRWFTYLVVWTTLLGGLRVYRCVWVLEKVVAVLTGPEEDDEEGEVTG